MAATTTDAEHRFWTYTSASTKYRDLVEEYEQNIEIDKPRSGYSCDALPATYGHCSWCASSVTYYEYNGPSI